MDGPCRRVAALYAPGPLPISDFGRGHGFVLCNRRPSVRSASDCRSCTEAAGGRARLKSVFEKLNALGNAYNKTAACCGARPTLARQLTHLVLRCIGCCLLHLQSSSQWPCRAVQAFARGASALSTMLHADVDVPAGCVPCVCSGSLLLLLSSMEAAETQPEAAVHRPRKRAAAFCVVGVA